MLVFVYGTLKRNFGNFGVMERAGGEFVGEALTTPEYNLINLGWFPGMVGGRFQVKGEVFDVADIAPIDRLEGAPTLYRRERVDIDSFITGPHLYIAGHIHGYLYNRRRDEDESILDDEGVKEWRNE